VNTNMTTLKVEPAQSGWNLWLEWMGLSVLRASDGTLVKTVRARSSPGAMGFDGTNMWVVNLDHTIGKR
jgi:hypothetical protein